MRLLEKALLSLTMCLSVLANSVSFNLENPSQAGPDLEMSSGGSPLPLGSLIELGYFEGDTATFTGNWAPLGSTTLSGSSAGFFRTSLAVDLTTAPGSELALGSRLALRFYDSPDNTGSFNTVINIVASEWAWPIDPQNIPSTSGAPITLLLLNTSTFMGPDPNLLWEDNGNAFETTLTANVPDPVIEGTSLSGGQFLINVSSLVPSKSYRLMRATDLISFAAPIGPVFTGAANHDFVDTAPLSGAAFYRIVQQ